MSKITYKHHELDVRVFLDDKFVGTIKRTVGGWVYRPRGSKATGEPNMSLNAVKASLEAA